MLQTQTVVPELLELLKNIMTNQTFEAFNLVGGTSLALQMGHRNSVDIDLFGEQKIETDLFLDNLKNFGSVEIKSQSKNIFITTINGIKVDFVNYKYPLLEPFIFSNQIRLVSKKDIAAMKLNAIVGRGSKKDFIDLFFLMQEYSLPDMMGFFIQKYNEGSLFLLNKSLTYFEEADMQPNPIVYDKHFNWDKCKQKILDEALKL